MAASAARPARVFDDETNFRSKVTLGGAGGLGPRQVKRNCTKKTAGRLSFSYVTVNNYRTNFDDFREVYLFGSHVDIGLSKEAGH